MIGHAKVLFQHLRRSQFHRDTVGTGLRSSADAKELAATLAEELAGGSFGALEIKSFLSLIVGVF
jgi:hypothetical protein